LDPLLGRPNGDGTSAINTTGGAPVFVDEYSAAGTLIQSIAFPIAGPIAAQYHVVVPAADLALAERLADFWWLFGLLAIASVGAAVVVAVKAIEHLSPAPRD
jgi:hypothetical protein